MLCQELPRVKAVSGASQQLKLFQDLGKPARAGEGNGRADLELGPVSQGGLSSHR
jgi:hypothetical protein